MIKKEQTGRLLLLDDDTNFLITLKIFLENSGFNVTTTTTGKEAHQFLLKHNIDLIILDINLKNERGTELCREFREMSKAFILMLTAINYDDTRMLCFEHGADNYITKPCSNIVLLAQIKAMLKWKKLEDNKASIYRFSGFELNTKNTSLINPNGNIIPLSSSEYSLLLTFLNNPQKTLSRDELLYSLRNRHHTHYERTVDIQLCRLRKKLNYHESSLSLIKTIHQQGYCFTSDVIAI